LTPEIRPVFNDDATRVVASRAGLLRIALDPLAYGANAEANLKQRASLDATIDDRSAVESWKVRLAVLASARPLAAGCDWSTFGYGPTHTRLQPESRARSAPRTSRRSRPRGADFYHLRWRSSPSVASGIEFIGSDDGKLYRVRRERIDRLLRNAQDLHTDVERRNGGPIASSPAVVNGIA